MQVEFQTDLERRMPQKLLEKVDKNVYRVYPNACSAGMFSFIFSKIKVSSNVEDMNTEENRQRAYFQQELYKQKMRLKEMSGQMQKQYDLLRLIVQKMEIHTEDDNRDEGLQTTESLEFFSPIPALNPDSKWKSVMASTTMAKQWSKTVKK